MGKISSIKICFNMHVCVCVCVCIYTVLIKDTLPKKYGPHEGARACP